MNLKEILVKMTSDGSPVFLSDGQSNWEAAALLKNLSEQRLKTRAHLQPGLYIAEVDAAGYLGRVMYRLKPKN